MKNQNGVSHTAQIRAQFEADEKGILFFTGMTEDALSDFKLDTGKEWLTKYCLRHKYCNQEDAQEMWQEPLLLQWWNLEWKRMDHFYILPILHKIVAGEREAVYREMHCEVFVSFHPNYVLAELSLMRILTKRFSNVTEPCLHP